MKVAAKQPTGSVYVIKWIDQQGRRGQWPGAMKELYAAHQWVAKARVHWPDRKWLVEELRVPKGTSLGA